MTETGIHKETEISQNIDKMTKSPILILILSKNAYFWKSLYFRKKRPTRPFAPRLKTKKRKNSLLQHTRAQHGGKHVLALALVRRDYADLVGRHAGAQHLRDQLLHVHGLHAVEVRRARGRELLEAERGVEEHGPLGVGPLEAHGRALAALRRGHAVLQRALVERVGGELGEARVHAVLRLQAHGAVAQHYEPLEERLFSCFGEFMAKFRWGKSFCHF